MMVSVRILAFLALAVVGLRAELTNGITVCTNYYIRLECELFLPMASNSSAYRELQWYQRYNDKPDSRIGITPVVPFKTQLMFVLWIENFDEQTDIYAVLNSGEGSKATIPYPIRNINKKKYFTETKPYSESELVNFTCKNGDSQVGWIDPTGNRITTYAKANHSQKFHKEDNGSMICCLLYETQDTILNRYIDDCTLIYVEPSTQHTHVPKAKLPFRDHDTCIEEVESCYKIHATPKKWDDAIKVCQSEGASLFYPVNSTEVNAVISFWQSTSKEIRHMYLGISDIETEGQFKTIDGTPIDEVYHKWHPNQPDNYMNNENCLQMYPTGYYNDVQCTGRYSFICKKSLLSPERSIQHNLNVPKAKLPFRDDYTCIEEVESCYKIHATPKNWDAAIKVCQSEGASLFYPVNSTEVIAVISFWQSTSKEIRYMYVGISDIETEGQFKTIDGTPIDEIYQKWNRNQPDNYNNNEHCLHMYPNGNYNDVPCSTPYSFICKKSLLSPERSIQHNLNTRNVITTEEPNSESDDDGTVSTSPRINIDTATIKSTASYENTSETSEGTKTSSSTVTILYSICGVGLTALVIVGIYWCWSTRRPQGTHGLPVINKPTEPFYLNMLFRRQCDQEIAEIDQLYEEIDQHHTPGVVRG